MKKSIIAVVITTGFVMATDILAAGAMHVFNNSSYTITVTPSEGKPVSVSSKKVTSKYVGSSGTGTTYTIKSTPTNAKIVLGSSIQYGKVDAQGNFIGATKKAKVPSTLSGDAVLCIDVGYMSPKDGIAVEIRGFNDEYLQGYARQ